MAAVSPHERESGIREIFDVESGLLRFEIRNLKESGSHFLFEFGIQVPLTRIPESSTWNLEIPSVESRIQDCPRFPYIGRAVKLFFTLLRYSGLREVLHKIMALVHVYVRRANFTSKPRFKMRLGAQPFL